MALTTGPRSLVTQRQVRGMTAAALVLAVLTGVIVWFAGSDDRALDEACGGALAADEVRTVLGGNVLWQVGLLELWLEQQKLG